MYHSQIIITIQFHFSPLHRTDWEAHRGVGDVPLFLLGLKMMQDTLVEVLVLLPGLHHQHPDTVQLGHDQLELVLPLLPQLIDRVEHVHVRGGPGVEVLDDLVDADEGPSPADPGAAVDEERSPGSSTVSVDHDVGQLDQLDQVTSVSRGRSVRPVGELEVDDDPVMTRHPGLLLLLLPSSQAGHVQLPDTVVRGLRTTSGVRDQKLSSLGSLNISMKRVAHSRKTLSLLDAL